MGAISYHISSGILAMRAESLASHDYHRPCCPCDHVLVTRRRQKHTNRCLMNFLDYRNLIVSQPQPLILDIWALHTSFVVIFLLYYATWPSHSMQSSSFFKRPSPLTAPAPSYCRTFAISAYHSISFCRQSHLCSKRNCHVLSYLTCRLYSQDSQVA